MRTFLGIFLGFIFFPIASILINIAVIFVIPMKIYFSILFALNNKVKVIMQETNHKIWLCCLFIFFLLLQIMINFIGLYFIFLPTLLIMIPIQTIMIVIDTFCALYVGITIGYQENFTHTFFKNLLFNWSLLSHIMNAYSRLSQWISNLHLRLTENNNINENQKKILSFYDPKHLSCFLSKIDALIPHNTSSFTLTPTELDEAEKHPKLLTLKERYIDLDTTSKALDLKIKNEGFFQKIFNQKGEKIIVDDQFIPYMEIERPCILVKIYKNVIVLNSTRFTDKNNALTQLIVNGKCPYTRESLIDPDLPKGSRYSLFPYNNRSDVKELKIIVTKIRTEIQKKRL